MKIGLDIDNVISNFNDTLLDRYLMHDKEVRNKGIINPDAYIRKMFDWTVEEEQLFYNNNIERIAKDLNIIEGAKEYIDKLKQEEIYIYIITGRDNGEYEKVIPNGEPDKCGNISCEKGFIYEKKLRSMNYNEFNK